MSWTWAAVVSIAVTSELHDAHLRGDGQRGGPVAGNVVVGKRIAIVKLHDLISLLSTESAYACVDTSSVFTSIICFSFPPRVQDQAEYSGAAIVIR